MDPGVKSKTFYIVRRCASIWRGPGFFWSCICGERESLKLGFCRSVCIKYEGQLASRVGTQNPLKTICKWLKMKK